MMATLKETEIVSIGGIDIRTVRANKGTGFISASICDEKMNHILSLGIRLTDEEQNAVLDLAYRIVANAIGAGHAAVVGDHSKRVMEAMRERGFPVDGNRDGDTT
jgi:hypothetical protein